MYIGCQPAKFRFWNVLEDGEFKRQTAKDISVGSTIGD